MTKREAIKLVKSYDIFSRFTLERLSRGNNSDAFLIKAGGKKYTLRTRREDSRHQNLLKNHYINLKFLEAAGIDFAPRAVHFDEKDKALLATYLPGRDIVVRGFKGREMDTFCKYLVKVNSLSYSLYKKVCKENRFKISIPETPQVSINKYGVKRFNYVKRYSPEAEITHWIKPRLKESIDYLNSRTWGARQMEFNHGDLTGANIMVNRGKIYIIDWERSRFLYSRCFGMGYMLLHFEYFMDNKDRMLCLLAKHSNRNLKSLTKDTYMSMKGIKVNDIIWAAWTYSELKKHNQRGWKKYRKMTYNRIKEYEEFFETK